MQCRVNSGAGGKSNAQPIRAFWKGWSIHPSIFFWWQPAYQGVPSLLLTINVFQLLLGEPKMLPGHSGHRIPSASPGPTLRPSSRWMCPAKILLRGCWSDSDQIPKPPQLSPFDTTGQRLYSELPSKFCEHGVNQIPLSFKLEIPTFWCCCWLVTLKFRLSRIMDRTVSFWELQTGWSS